MSEHSLADVGQLNQQGAQPVVIGRGAHATIELDSVSMLVCKQFHTPDATTAAQLARREFDYLQRFSAALADEPYLQCPKPVRLEPEQGRVWMEYCPGSSLEHALETSNDTILEHLPHIAGQIAIAVQRYIAEFDEPYDDLTTNNMLYDPATRTLSLVDFASPVFSRHFGPERSPLELSLGTFIGVTTYHTVRPATCRNKIYWERQERLSLALLDSLSACGDLSPLLVRHASAAVYTSVGRRGRPLRQLWYATVGQALFNRRSNALIARLAPDP